MRIELSLRRIAAKNGYWIKCTSSPTDVPIRHVWIVHEAVPLGDHWPRLGYDWMEDDFKWIPYDVAVVLLKRVIGEWQKQ